MFHLYRLYLKKYKVHVIFGPIFKLVEAVFELLVPLIIADMINNGLNNSLLTQDEKIHYILLRGGLLLIFAVVGLCSTLVCQFFASRASQGFGTALRDDLYKHINTLSFRELDELDSSTLLTRMNNDINNMQVSVAMLIRLVVRAPFLIIGATILSFMVDFYSGLIFLCTGILLFFVIFIIMGLTIPKNKKAQVHLDKTTNITKENINGNRVVRAFRRQNSEFKRFCDEAVDLKKVQVRIGRLNALLNPFIFIITNLAIVFVLYVAGLYFNTSNLLQGNLTSLYGYLLQIQLAVMFVANLVVIFTKAQVSSTRINEVFNLENSIIDGSVETPLNNTPIEFKNVSFKYNPNSLNALNNLNFKIEKNQVIGIIGSTGSGKTTLINVLNRFYDVTDGEILLYGRNIKDYKLDYVRKNISTVFQHSTLFNGTIESNLKWADEYASSETIDKALEVSQSKDFVYKKENGLNERVYQGGKNFSGGQRQRLSIARALVKNSPILILDDSKSALDYKTSLELSKALRKLDITVIDISQRASDMKNCDMVLVLDKGNLVGLGKHKDLIKTCDVYKEICYSQDEMEVE